LNRHGPLMIMDINKRKFSLREKVLINLERRDRLVFFNIHHIQTILNFADEPIGNAKKY